MSYSIIFKTIIAKTDDGRIVHFNRSGCNNDDVGRKENEFTAKLYTQEEWEKEIKHWEDIERYEDDGFDLKIGSRYCQWADYGKHLRTMTKRAKKLSDLHVYGHKFVGIYYYDENNNVTEYLADDPKLDDIVYGIWYGRVKGRYSNNIKPVTKENLLEELEHNNGRHIEFSVR